MTWAVRNGKGAMRWAMRYIVKDENNGSDIGSERWKRCDKLDSERWKRCNEMDSEISKMQWDGQWDV